jgi:hypothetical protein
MVAEAREVAVTIKQTCHPVGGCASDKATADPLSISPERRAVYRNLRPRDFKSEFARFVHSMSTMPPYGALLRAGMMAFVRLVRALRKKSKKFLQLQRVNPILRLSVQIIFIESGGGRAGRNVSVGHTAIECRKKFKIEC